MTISTHEHRRWLQTLDREEFARYQLRRLNELFGAILPANRLYADKLAQLRGPVGSLDEFAALPFTFKEELADPHQPGLVARNQTWPLERYVRFHQTSGTRGRPLPVLDTLDDWQWWMECWQYVLDAGDVAADDRVLMAFSFGPFVGFWSAHDAMLGRGCLVVPGGGVGTLGRLELLRNTRATIFCSTPSYALHLGEIAANHQIDVAETDLRLLLLAGEPGGSIPATRARLETLFGARVLDHSGATEVGPWGFGDREGQGLYVNEAEFIAEFLSVETGAPAGEGDLAELVLTNLGRVGSPVIRYRTGDLVRPSWRHTGESRFVFLPGGILGRADDMLIVRGVNVFPSAIEQIVRSFPEVIEYRVTAHKQAEMDQLSIEIEDRLEQPERVAEELRLRLGLKVAVRAVEIGSLPRFEGKGKRFLDNR